ncbi:translation protein SH3-like domain-containing protein [Phlyctochytrium arcticum]|nr:translation protein SH3-like domain-containing protein [Phlyctochytrium arcticum]
MPKPKMRGANFMKPKRPKIAEADRIKTWKIFPGDRVEVINAFPAGAPEYMLKDVGKQGKVLSVIKDMNAVVVEGLRMVHKHIKPNPEYPQGTKIRKEMPIPYSHVRLVDPATGVPHKVKLISTRNPITQRQAFTRVSLLDNRTMIPAPEEKDPFDDKKEGALDTTKDVVAKQTFQLNITQCPFPSAFMNELERMRRKNRESQAL